MILTKNRQNPISLETFVQPLSSCETVRICNFAKILKKCIMHA